MFLRDGLTSGAWGDWAISEASSLRAFVNVLHTQDPAHFCNPWRFTTDGGTLAPGHEQQHLHAGRNGLHYAPGDSSVSQIPLPSAGLKFAVNSSTQLLCRKYLRSDGSRCKLL